MTITLKPETEKLLQEQIDRGLGQDADAVVRLALETMLEVEGEAIEDMDDETQASIARAEAQSARGEGRDWDEVEKELRHKFGL